MSKTYFLAPSRDIPPAGPIALGSIIKSPRSPELSLNGKKSPILQTLEVYEHVLTDSSKQLVKSKSGSVGVWTEFLSGVLGIGGDIGTSWENTDIATYNFKELITKSIAPDLDTVRSLFEEPAVQKAIKDSRMRANLYMITGIKIARGADVVVSKVRSKGGNLYFGVDTTAAGVPIKVGPDLAGAMSTENSSTEHHGTDFVFAYRLRELVYRKKSLNEQKAFDKGDLMGHGEKRNKLKEEEGRADANVEAEFRGMNGDDLKAEEYELEPTAVVDDDGEVVNCVILDDDDDDDDNDE